jgi:hypothetical protein
MLAFPPVPFFSFTLVYGPTIIALQFMWYSFANICGVDLSQPPLPFVVCVPWCFQVWVPSDSNVEAFKLGGVSPSKLFVLPQVRCLHCFCVQTKAMDAENWPLTLLSLELCPIHQIRDNAHCIAGMILGRVWTLHTSTQPVFANPTICLKGPSSLATVATRVHLPIETAAPRFLTRTASFLCSNGRRGRIGTRFWRLMWRSLKR